MPQFMLVLGGVDKSRRSTSVNYEEVMLRYKAWGDKLRTKKQFVDSHKLEDGVGRRLSFKEGKVQDGPFAESKETIGGYYIIEAKDLDEAAEIAKECPTVTIHQGFCEVRPVEI